MRYLFVFFVLLSLIFFKHGFAQSYEQYNWEETPSAAILQSGDESEPEVMLFRHIQYEYLYEDLSSPSLFYTRHEIIKVNTDEAIASNNRIYIPMSRVLELIEVHARTINPDGSVIEVSQQDIKEVEDEEADAGYKIFAIEGARIGSIIEYYYTSKMATNFFGREYLQFKYPTRQASFKLMAPANLLFEFKSYQGFPEVVKADSIQDKNVYVGSAQNIPSLKPEKFSVYNDNRKRIEFKLAYNKAQGNVRLFTWDAAGKHFYSQVHNLEKQEEKIVQKILKQINVDQYNTPYLKAAAIEDYIKTKFYIDDNRSNNNYHIDFMYKNRFGSKYGITRLTVALLEKAGIPIELVLTNDRHDVRFDSEFDSYNYLEDYLVYLPEEDKYIAPYHVQLRLNMTPAEYTANRGLFIRTMMVRDYAHPVAEIKYIAPAKAQDNADNMDIAVDFNDDLTSTSILLNRSFKGYQASYFKALLPLLEVSKREELLKELVKYMSHDSDIEELGFEKTVFDFKAFQEPLILKGKFNTSAFVEHAGPVTLFKVGELIGPQSELYQEEERILPIENEYNRSYLRTIEVRVPKNQEIQNLNDIMIDAEAKNAAGETVYSFKSNYILKDNLLQINIIELYHEISYPVDKFEDFRKVINAAADFNKVVLVMKQK